MLQASLWSNPELTGYLHKQGKMGSFPHLHRKRQKGKHVVLLAELKFSRAGQKYKGWAKRFFVLKVHRTPLAGRRIWAKGCSGHSKQASQRPDCTVPVQKGCLLCVDSSFVISTKLESLLHLPLTAAAA